MEFTRNDISGFYETMVFIRLFEEKAVELYKQNIAFGNMHMHVGEEAIATGVMKALAKEDIVTSSHRCHGHFLAKGADPGRIMAELMGREGGYCKGRGGKMHLVAPEVGVMGANGIVGAGIPLAAGHALYSSLFNQGQVTVCFFGDGAVNHGYFHEGINMAALWKLPVVFVCENNLYAISTHISTAMACDTVAQRAAAYGIPGVEVDGNDVLEVYRQAQKAVDRARRGEGPSLLECKTYRFRGHHEGDDQSYRTKEEVAAWKEKCPLKRTKELLEKKYRWTEQDDKAVYDKGNARVQAAVDFGLQSLLPSSEDIAKYVFISEV